MVFDILFRGYGDEITDPDTGEVLGGVDRPKARVKVVTANESKLSIGNDVSNGDGERRGEWWIGYTPARRFKSANAAEMGNALWKRLTLTKLL